MSRLHIYRSEELPVGSFVVDMETEDVKLTVLTYGGYITRWKTKDRNGNFGNVTLRYSSLGEYISDTKYLGCVCGRYCNRIANGKFSIDGVEYQLARNNNGVHALHGGPNGFHRKVFTLETATMCSVGENGEKSIVLSMSCVSVDGEEGYPGTVKVTVTYTLHGSILRIDYSSTLVDDDCAKATILNLTNHSYFNLSNNWEKSCEDHCIKINSESIVEVDGTLIPTGRILSVCNDAPSFDFRKQTRIGDQIDGITTPQLATNIDQINRAGGYDHTFIKKNN